MNETTGTENINLVGKTTGTMNQQNLKNFIEEGEKEFEEKFLFLKYGDGTVNGGGKGTYMIPRENLSLYEILDWHKQRQISLIKMIVERMKEEIWAYHKLNNEWLKKYNVSEELEKELNEMFMHSHNEPLDTISSKLKELTDGK